MKKIFEAAILFALLFASAGPLQADEIYLSNGDKITGEIVNESDESITVSTEAMGSVTINKAYVKTPEPPAPPETEKSPWERKVSLGYSRTGGNTKKGQGNLALAAGKKTDGDEWTIKGDAYYSSSNDKMDAKKFYGMARYASSFGEDMKWYNFYKLEGDQDRFANIDYRLIPSTGVGYWFSDEEDYKLMAEIAIGLEHTNYRDKTKDKTEAVLIPRGFFEKKLVGDLRVSEEIVMYPSLGDFGEYRLHSETSLINPISEQMSWKISFIDDFNSDPAGSTKKNDYRLVTSVEYAF